MKPRTKRFLLVLGCLLLLGAAGMAWLAHSFLPQRLAATRKGTEAVARTLECGRLAPIPVSAQEVAVFTSGATLASDRTFKRSVMMSFLAPPADIEHWLHQSPGTREVVPTTSPPLRRHFEVVPGAEAVLAEVTVDDAQHHVSIDIRWN